jgi:hypothetical protein
MPSRLTGCWSIAGIQTMFREKCWIDDAPKIDGKRSALDPNRGNSFGCGYFVSFQNNRKPLFNEGDTGYQQSRR